MNWDAVGAIGDLVAGVAIVITLVFLAFQTRSNTAAIRAHAVQDLLLKSADIYIATISDNKLMEIFGEKLPNGVPLEPAEKAKVWFMLHGILTNIQFGFVQHGKGHIEEEIFETYRARTRRIIVTDGIVFDAFWEERQNEFIKSFRTWIDQIKEGI